jgi:hypothetical protein
MQRSKVVFRKTILLLLLLLPSGFSFAQAATLQHNSNLRRSPNTHSAILESLNKGDTVTVTSTTKRSGYYHVQASDGTIGWVLARNVVIGQVPSNGGTPPPPGLPAQLAAAVLKAVPQPLVINGQNVCGPTGDAADAKTQALDSNKNRTDIPDASTYILVNWNELANLPSDQADNLQGAPVEVVGYLSHRIAVENSGSGESTNCHLVNDNEVDWHMYLTQQPAQGIADAIIVETTPRTRPLHSWDKSALDALIDSNTKVRISGWLMYDWQHVGVIGRQRATVWEVHPVTRIETQDANGNWKNVEQ